MTDIHPDVQAALDSARDLRHRIPDVPLADLVVIVPFHQIEMDVVLMIAV